MKRILFFALLLVLAVSVQAQRRVNTQSLPYAKETNLRPVENMLLPKAGGNIYRLEGYVSSDGFEVTEYTYDGDKLIAVHEQVYGDHGYNLFDSISYNAQGQLVRLDGWQFIDNNWKNVYYVEYGYNAQGLIASRTNYNNFSNEWNLGGVYDYTYNADGQIIRSELTMMNMLFSTADYTYSQGKLQSIEYQDYDFEISGLTTTAVVEYQYAGDALTNIDHYDYENGQQVFSYTESFTYDANGNCTVYFTRDAYNRETLRREFEFDNRLLSETLMPWHPEIERPYTYTNNNLYTVEHWYMADDNYSLQYMWDYEYDYTGGNNSIASVSAAQINCYPNPTSGTLQVEAAEGETVQLYDMMGRCLSTTISAGNVTLQLPRSGIYLVKVGTAVQQVVCY